MDRIEGEWSDGLDAAPRRPGPARPSVRALTLLGGLVVAFWLLGTVANALAPTLLVEHPLVLVALEPRNRYLLLTAGRVDVVPYVAFATFRRIASDPVYFALGHLYGDRAVRWLEGQAGPRGARFVRWVERGYRRFSRLAVFLFPGLLVCVLAGATGMRIRTFLAWNLAGTVSAVVAIRLFAHQIEGPVVAVNEFIERYQTSFTMASVALVLSYLAWQRRRGEGELAAFRDLTDADLTDAGGPGSTSARPSVGSPVVTDPTSAGCESTAAGDDGRAVGAEPWWRSAVVYQVYPRSFADANGDGVGDLRGIIDHVDHLVDLGVDAVWLSPFYESPMRDNGYDIADHCSVDPVFGTLDDFDELVAALHGHGIKLIVDFVPNHVSSDHPWFVEAVRDPASERRGYFFWSDPRPDGGPPTNWTASFTNESAWELDEASGQYYLHLFLPSQPDVDWSNPAVEAAQHDVLRFWLDRGVDGFRIDVINAIGKDPDPRDVPERALGIPHVVLTHHDTAIPLIERIRRTVDTHGDPTDHRFVVGEVVTGDLAVQATYAAGGAGINVPVNFASVWAPWDAAHWRRIIAETEDAYPHDGPAWPSYVLSNHDYPRSRTRYGGGEARARAAGVLLLGLRGTPFLYQGEELGLEDAVIEPGTEIDPGGRDGCRAPIPWTASDGHGWPGVPWLPFPPDAGDRSAEVQRDDPTSTLATFRAILACRRTSPALRLGRLDLLDGPDEVVAFRRVQGDDERVVIVNFADLAVDVDPDPGTGWTVSVASDAGASGGVFGGTVGPATAVILERSAP